MRSRAALLAVLILLAAGGVCVPIPQERFLRAASAKGKGKFTVGRETTYVTGPLEQDGYIDYPSALNKRLSKGVTPANNAAVLLVKAFGPRPMKRTESPEFFRWMGMPAPPERGDYLIGLSHYLTKRPRTEFDLRTDDIDAQRADACGHPWKGKDFPVIAEWLKSNQKPLALIIEATKRPRFFWPMVPPTTKGRRDALVNTPLPGLQLCRESAFALTARAMLRVGQGNADDAWQDLLACHRLGRLMGGTGGFLQGFIGVSIDLLACAADVAFLGHLRPNAKRLENCLRDLQALPPLPEMADKMDVAERLMFLDTVQACGRYGISYLEYLSKDGPWNPGSGKDLTALVKIDWDPAYRTVNRWFDRIAAAMLEQHYPTWRKKLDRLDTELRAYHKQSTDPRAMGEKVLRGWLTPRIFGEVLGDLLTSHLMPAFSKVRQAADRDRQANANGRLAFALAWYQRIHGRYPKTLDELAPKYLKRVPGDYFSGKPLIYRPSDKGYLLYSVGPNGKDEGGQGYGDMPPGDDQSVRMPLPAPRK